VEALGNFSEVFEHLPPYQRKDLMRLVLQKAVVGHDWLELALYGKPPELSHMTQGAVRSQTSDWLPKRPFRRDEFTVPREDRVRRDDGRDLAQGFSTQRLTFGGQSATLVVGETQASPARPKLFHQNTILFYQVGNSVRLLTGNPAGERRQEEL
jgi:hypothetical protein